MKARRSGKVRKVSPVEKADVAAAPFLPAWKAFTVQFSRDSGVKPGVFEGRVEHLNSGRRVRFGSRRALLTSLQDMLDEIAETSK